ncbi:YbaN family protein [Nitrospira defluvii]|nr:YbaN family protein [Nitrospira defluvii]
MNNLRIQESSETHGNRSEREIKDRMKQTPSGSLKQRLYLYAGFLSVAVGTLGIVLPILPTTEFMLLGLFCFARSSTKWHRWLLTHPIFGNYIKAFRDKRGLTLHQKRQIGMTMTVMLSITAIFGPAPLAIWIAATVWIIGMAFLIFSRSATPIDLNQVS